MVKDRDLGRRKWALCGGLLALLSGSGCVAASAAVQSTKAARAVEHARRSNAGEHAPYEFALAEAYLAKAREEASQAEYQDANRLSRKSQENAAKAVERSRAQRAGGGR